jgi:quercetin dioxygenase-like cupin family protein
MSEQAQPVAATDRTFVRTFSYVPVSPALWRKDFWPFFDYRDLALHGASKGGMSAEHLRFTGQGDTNTGWYSHDFEFDWIYVLKGHVSVTYASGESTTLNVNDAILLPAGYDVRFSEYSKDYEALEITAPAKANISVRDAPRTLKAGIAKPNINRDSPESHVKGEGLRRFFSYRELGIADLSKRKFQLHVITVHEQPTGGTGWHFHKAGQFAYVLDGWATVDVQKQPSIHFEAGDSMTVCPGYGHNVPEFSMKYKVIELIAPADYDTIGIEHRN